MMILDWITDWIVTTWELIGLAFLWAGADPMNFDRWEAAAGGDKRNDTASRPAASSSSKLQHHFA
jgi:hypothetical protein